LVEVRRTLERIRDGWVDRKRRTLSKPWAERPITSLTRDDVQGLIAAIKQHNPTTAARTLAYLRAFLSWSRDEGGARGLEVNVAAGVKAPKTTKRTRFLSEDELADVWACMDVLGEPAGDLFKVMLLTGQRRTEGCAAMRWAELDSPAAPTLWTTPGDRAKNHEEHVLPLSRAVAEIIRRRYQERDTQADSPFVFPATRQRAADKRKSGSDEPTHFSGFNTAKRRLDAAIAKRRAERGALPMAPWVLHDWRRSITSHVNGREGIRALIRQLRAEAREAEYRRDGIEITPDLRARIERQAGDGVVGPHVAQQILNHSDAKPGIFATYDREKYTGDMRLVLEAYARWIVQISTPAAEAPAPNVVRLRAAR
jgi:integrase